jgi:LCP family protein required for cell wall assembly
MVFFMTPELEKRIVRQRVYRKRRMVTITVFLVMIIAIVGAAAFMSTSSPSTADSSDSVVEKAKQVLGLPAHKKINILLLGIDERKNDIGRSNVTCVVTIDTDTKKFSMLWIPRDSRVAIPDHGWNKIGHAYAYGGPKLSEQTVANLLGVPIDYYVSINMDGFKKVIDALGGVDIQVDKRMYYYDPYDEGEVDNDGLIDLKPGMQHMDGNIALEYVRFRHDEMGDIGRIERQQKFAKALLADVITPAVIPKVPSVIKEANTVFKTDMPISEMLNVATIMNDAYKQGLKTEMAPGKPVYIDDLSYWLPDITATRKQIAQIQGITIDDKYLASARNLASQYEKSLLKSKVIDAP